MMTRRTLLLGGGAAVAAMTGAALWRGLPGASEARAFEVSLSEDEWRERLSAEQFRVLREHGTEPPGSSPLLAEDRPGTFTCAGCGHAVYPSHAKFDSGTGWPSFYEAVDGGVGTRADYSLVIPRTEVHCARCGGHLGHVFEDGPAPTFLRHCINGAALGFEPATA